MKNEIKIYYKFKKLLHTHTHCYSKDNSHICILMFLQSVKFATSSELSALLWYNTASLGKCHPKIRGNIVTFSSKIKMFDIHGYSNPAYDTLHCFETSELIYWVMPHHLHKQWLPWRHCCKTLNLAPSFIHCLRCI